MSDREEDSKEAMEVDEGEAQQQQQQGAAPAEEGAPEEEPGEGGADEEEGEEGGEGSPSPDEGSQSESGTPTKGTQEMAALQAEIDECIRQIEEVMEGTHPDVADKIKALTTLKQSREEVARAYHTRLMTNAQELAAFERLNHHADLAIDLETAKEGLLDTVAQEVRRCEEEVRKLFSNREEGRPPPPPPALHPAAKRFKRPQRGLRLSAEGGEGGGGGGGAGGGAAVKSEPQEGKGGAGGKAAAAAEGEGGDSDAGGGGGAADGTAAGGGAPPIAVPHVPLCVTLSDFEMRSDFAAIVADWRMRALEFMKLAGDSVMPWCQVDLTRDARGQPAVRVDDAILKVGDKVTVYSRVTDEEFRGEITAVTADEVFLRLAAGTVPTRLHVDHLSSGRLRMRKAVSSR